MYAVQPAAKRIGVRLSINISTLTDALQSHSLVLQVQNIVLSFQACFLIQVNPLPKILVASQNSAHSSSNFQGLMIARRKGKEFQSRIVELCRMTSLL